MQTYGESILKATGQLPAGTEAPVGIEVSPNHTSGCDVHPGIKASTIS